VGVDYSAAMVKACQTKFSNLEFVVADVANLSFFPDASFHAVVFAFNGIDYVLPDECRRSCLGHIRRVLKPGGVVIFSSHNPRSVLVRPSWNQERLLRIARSFSAGYWLVWIFLTAMRSTLAVAQAMEATIWRAVRRIPSRMFWHGHGTLVDPVHGGLLTHYSTPSCVLKELAAFQFRPERILGNDYPKQGYRYATDWYYYVFTKTCEK